MKTTLKEELPFCECGCGKRVKKPGNRVIYQHNLFVDRKIKTIEDYQTVAIDRDIKWISKHLPKTTHHKTWWECEKGHQWEARYHDIQRNHGCPKCKYIDQAEKMTGENNPTKRKEICQKLRKPKSEKHKQKISKTRIKKGVAKGKNNPMFGVRLCGEKHWNWQGGITIKDYCSIWKDKEYKQSIRNRDRNIAWDIGYWYKGRICLNHINYNKKDCSPQNLITVSIGMNAAINHHKEFYTEWFQTAMNHRLGYEYGT